MRCHAFLCAAAYAGDCDRGGAHAAMLASSAAMNGNPHGSARQVTAQVRAQLSGEGGSIPRSRAS